MASFNSAADPNKILDEKSARRAQLKREFLKEQGNPYRHGQGSGGHIFDKGIQRFQAMRFLEYDSFRPTSKTAMNGLLILAVPMVVYGYLLKSSRDKQEELYRTGQVAYKDRRNKFV